MTDITYSEMFYSPQGEGKYTGVPTVWLRFHLCNLQCDGFGQKDPTDRSTYELPYKDFDETKVNSVEELPVFERGCDSSYTWAKKFKHLMKTEDHLSVVDGLHKLMTNEHNSHGRFGSRHMCFTGGEPLLKANQRGVSKIVDEFVKNGDIPLSITFETNGTQFLTETLMQSLVEYKNVGGEVFMSISPKLFEVSGEMASKAIKPDVIDQLMRFADDYQLKFVLNDDDHTWKAFDEMIMGWKRNLLMSVFSEFDNSRIWIMPVGATEESQYNIAAAISDRAIARGYNVAARVHAYIYGNQIGT